MGKSCNDNVIALYTLLNIVHQTIYGTQDTLVLSSFVRYMTASDGDKIYSKYSAVPYSGEDADGSCKFNGIECLRIRNKQLW